MYRNTCLHYNIQIKSQTTYIYFRVLFKMSNIVSETEKLKWEIYMLGTVKNIAKELINKL